MIELREFLEKKKNLVRPWKSSRRLLLSSGFSVTVCIATLSERLLLEGGASAPPPRYTYVHGLSSSPLSWREILKKGSSTLINFDSTTEPRHFDDDHREVQRNVCSIHAFEHTYVIYIFVVQKSYEVFYIQIKKWCLTFWLWMYILKLNYN